MPSPDHRLDSPPDQPDAAEHLSDAEFALLLRQGPIAPLSVWRRAYQQLGIPWPGQAEIRRRHRVTHRHRVTDTDTAPAITVWPMSWPTTDPPLTTPTTTTINGVGAGARSSSPRPSAT